MAETASSLERILAKREAGTGPIVKVDEPMLKLVIVSLGDQWFAFRGEHIQEILAECPVFFLPGCPPSLEGVINVRGDIQSVIRLRSLLGLAPDAAGQSRILLGRTAAIGSGVRVDRVEEVCDIPESSLQKAPNNVPEHLRSLILGVFEFRGHPVHLLDLDRIFDDYRAGLQS